MNSNRISAETERRIQVQITELNVQLLRKIETLTNIIKSAQEIVNQQTLLHKITVAKNEELELRIDKLEHENALLKEKQVKTVNAEKQHNVIISGINDSEQESEKELLQKVKSVLSKELQVTADIDTVRRLGPYGKDKTRKIITRFTKQSDKLLVLSLKKRLKERKGDPIYINPDLPAEISLKRFLEREAKRKERNEMNSLQTTQTSLETTKQPPPVFDINNSKITAREHPKTRKARKKKET